MLDAVRQATTPLDIDVFAQWTVTRSTEHWLALLYMNLEYGALVAKFHLAFDLRDPKHRIMLSQIEHVRVLDDRRCSRTASQGLCSRADAHTYGRPDPGPQPRRPGRADARPDGRGADQLDQCAVAFRLLFAGVQTDVQPGWAWPREAPRPATPADDATGSRSIRRHSITMRR